MKPNHALLENTSQTLWSLTLISDTKELPADLLFVRYFDMNVASDSKIKATYKNTKTWDKTFHSNTSN